MENIKNIFVCPLCKSNLLDGENYYTCKECRTAWPVRDGVPVFLEEEVPYWNDITKDQAAVLLKEAESQGYRKAAEKLLNTKIRNFMYDESRSNLKYIIDSDTTGNILDIGSGWGAHAFTFAKTSSQVFGLEPVWERVKFTEIRKRQDNISNLHFVAASALKMPFADNFFDLVIANGVMEWIALSDMTQKPHKVQEQMLKEIYRVLKPGGSLYIGIENRFAYFYFLGKRDPHSGLRFGTLFPYPIANIYSKFVKKREYRTCIYSLEGHRRFLRKSGFRKIRFFTPVPSYLTFKYLVPLEPFDIFVYWFSNILYNTTLFSVPILRKSFAAMKIVLRCLPTGFLKYFVPDFAIVACKQ